MSTPSLQSASSTTQTPPMATASARRKGSVVDFLKVLDFGLVKRAGAIDESTATSLNDSLLGRNETAAGQLMGTPAFMPPESILGEHAVDHRADIYALGCVAYWLLTGELVFEEPTVPAVLAAHLLKPPGAPSAGARAPLPSELDRIVLSCLEKDRELRPASAEALRVALSTIAFSEPWTRDRSLAWWTEHLPAVTSAALESSVPLQAPA